MSAKKTKQANIPQYPTTVNENAQHHHVIDSAHIEVKGAECNEHTRASIEALAKAAHANADAIAACARALQGGSINMEAGIKVGG